MDFERKIEKVEASMVLLEARVCNSINMVFVCTLKVLVGENKINVFLQLSSIPESNMVTVPLMPTQDVPIENKQTDIQETEIDYQKEETDSNDIPVRPEYDRFVKMVNVGVPLAAAKLKASLEGLDPNVLETLLKK